jgi:hypothetical protein
MHDPDFVASARSHFSDKVQVLETNSELIFIKDGNKFGQYYLKGHDWPPPEKDQAKIFKSIEKGLKDDKQRVHNLA